MSSSHPFAAAATLGPRRFDAVVVRIERLAPDVVGLVMAPSGNTRFTHRPGQYLSVALADGERRSFSMASPCADGRLIELHIRQRIGGRFSDALIGGLEVGDTLQIEGPFGQVDWREGDGPAILIGTGTGLAPLKALLEHALAADSRRAIHLYWGGRAPADLYLSAHLHQLASAHDRLRFTPLLSRSHAGWAGRRGYVQDAVAADFAHLRGADIYACGSPTMIDAARRRLADIPGFEDDRFQADAFEPAAPAAVRADAPSLSVFVTFQGAVRPVPASLDGTLLSALQAARMPILSVCGGKASCGACKIVVDEAWRGRLSPPERTERRLLANLDGAGPGDRLACQIRLSGAANGLAISLPPETTALWPA